MKKTVKLIVDAAMLALLLLLTAMPITGQELHEWLGIAEFALFIAHNILNASFFKTLFKGKYNASRALTLLLGAALWADFILLVLSSLRISGFVFDFLKLRGGMMTARRLHLCASYWGLVIMSAHLGVNWSAAFPVRKLKSAAAAWAARGAVIAVSAFGVWSFIQQKLPRCLFLKTHFMFFDYDMNKALFFAEYISMIALFAAAFYYLSKLLKRLARGNRRQESSGGRQGNG